MALLRALGISVVGLISVSAASTFMVKTGERAIVVNRIDGTIQDKVYSEGTHTKIPIVHKVVKYNVRPQPCEMNAIVYTCDTEKVRIDVRVLTHPLEHRLPTIHRNYGENYFELFLRAGIHKALGDVMVEYVTEQLIRGREEVRKGIHEQLTARFSEYDIVVDDVFITNVAIGKEEIAETEAKELIAQVEAKLEKKLNTLSSRVQGVDSRLDTFSMTVQGVDSRLGTLYSRVSGVESRSDRYIDNVQSLKARMLNVEAKQQSMERTPGCPYSRVHTVESSSDRPIDDVQRLGTRIMDLDVALKLGTNIEGVERLVNL